MNRAEGSVDRLYHQVKKMAAEFILKPDQRINEGQLSIALKASRTPLREALNRLVAEGYLTYQNGHGFACRTLSVEHIVDLYQARQAIECEAVRLAVARASDKAIAEVMVLVRRIEDLYQSADATLELARLDEDFHTQLTSLSQNQELIRLLDNINGRIRYIRLIDFQGVHEQDKFEVTSVDAHRAVLQAIVARDAPGAEAQMRSHIERRAGEATDSVQKAFAQIYAPPGLDRRRPLSGSRTAFATTKM